MREQLIRSNSELRSGPSRLGAALDAAGVDIAQSYVLDWIPDQGEDIYFVLVNAREVMVVEVPRGEGKVHAERELLSAFEKRCSKVNRLKIAVARSLVSGG